MLTVVVVRNEGAADALHQQLVDLGVVHDMTASIGDMLLECGSCDRTLVAENTLCLEYFTKTIGAGLKHVSFDTEAKTRTSAYLYFYHQKAQAEKGHGRLYRDQEQCLDMFLAEYHRQRQNSGGGSGD
jgi:hypothetical protein